MNNKTKIFLLAFLLVIISACSVFNFSKESSEDPPRTYYESLDLSTPESAVRTFAEAFAREDFMSVYLILSTRTQFVLHQYINLMQYDRLFQTEYRDEVFEDVSVFSEGLGEGEHTDMGWYLFDQIMLSAKKHSALLIDLSGEIEILESEKSETYSGDDAVDIITLVEGIKDEVVFRMVQAPSGRWRVLKVIVDVGNEDELFIPWSVPGSNE